ncbi:uncharacterized protein AB675_7341 [Cyphellophora attinorum]|uniref:VWFA domain-containing protein n=1 Tax=Cyphellophora attinorum TaxID=1664694 RepID=A0A0N1NX30_9EURO|nr:uncharacterized protein AB675_7341 [Phialophora attinorum]KPI36344.1 hypothetical protein AB675_7341 [Phialophora attinorum]
MAATTHHWELQQRLSTVLPLNDSELTQVLSHVESLSTDEACIYFNDLLGDSPNAQKFIAAFRDSRSPNGASAAATQPKTKADLAAAMMMRHVGSAAVMQHKSDPPVSQSSGANGKHAPATAAPSLPAYAPPPGRPPTSRALEYDHTNAVIEAARVRARDEYAKWQRYGVQDMWSKAVMYPGEKAYTDSKGNPRYGGNGRNGLWSSNPYMMRVVSPYGYNQFNWMGGPTRPIPGYHAKSIHQTIALNNNLNREAQAKIDAQEPDHNIWAEDGGLENAMSNLGLGDDRTTAEKGSAVRSEKRPSLSAPDTKPSTSRLHSFRKSIGMKTSTERAVSKATKAVSRGVDLREAILKEERGRWPDAQWQQIVLTYQDKVGMTKKIAALRNRSPIQYLHLLRAGYFEPIPVAWANQASNPLKFSIEAAAGWRGITPTWRGYEDTAEERLYWVLNHRDSPDGITRTRLKPDFISEMDMARARMASAVEPPPQYFSPDDTCHVQHTDTKGGYSRQVMPPPLHIVDRPEQPTDDTMILLDVSGSMDFDPVRPVYDQYLITQYVSGTQPKNKDVAKAIIRRFTDALSHHDHISQSGNDGYDLVTFSSQATYIGRINHANLDHHWNTKVRLGGGTRVMTGWQMVKDLHFRKHSASATYHPVYGWQAGPETPILRLLLLLDGEATDMDEFELDLLSLSWAHVTVFLVGVEGCPHHHRHANELQRIGDVNPHVSFVDAQGNCPERYVTHELLKRHLGYEVSQGEFEEMERLPTYSEVA